MLNYLWAFMIIIGIVYGAFTGNLNRVTDAALESASQAVTLCITMAGAMAFWAGCSAQNASNPGFSLSGHPKRPSGKSGDRRKLYFQYFRTGMGGHACGTGGYETSADSRFPGASSVFVDRVQPAKNSPVGRG